MLLRTRSQRSGFEDLLVGFERVERDLALVVAVAVALVAMLLENRGDDGVVFGDDGVVRVGGPGGGG